MFHFVKSNKAGDQCVDGMVPSHANLVYVCQGAGNHAQKTRTEAYVLAWVELSPSLPDDDVSWDHSLVCIECVCGPNVYGMKNLNLTNQRISLHPVAFPASVHGCVRYHLHALSLSALNRVL